MSTFPDVGETALAVARRLGIPCDRPVVLAEGMNVVVHLRPSPLVARVTRVAHPVRPAEALAGVVAMARALRGLVLPPSDQVDAGPHVEDGRYVTFWVHVEEFRRRPQKRDHRSARSIRRLAYTTLGCEASTRGRRRSGSRNSSAARRARYCVQRPSG